MLYLPELMDCGGECKHLLSKRIQTNCEMDEGRFDKCSCREGAAGYLCHETELSASLQDVHFVRCDFIHLNRCYVTDMLTQQEAKSHEHSTTIPSHMLNNLRQSMHCLCPISVLLLISLELV